VADTRSDTEALLRAEFGEEAEAGFPRLGKAPHTRVVQFLDYFAGLSGEDQSTLLDALASRASVLFNLSLGASFPSAPAFDRYYNAVTSQGPFTGGFRYCDIKFLASVPKIREFGSYEGWVEKHQKPWVSELALTPREDLLPDMSCLKPAKTRITRKLVREALENNGFKGESSRGAEHSFVSPKGDLLRIDFGSYMGQLCYGVSSKRGETRIMRMSYESLWSQPGGWDYVTEENVRRVVTLLPELANDLIRLTERIGSLR
jgi:hypothetical protein